MCLKPRANRSPSWKQRQLVPALLDAETTLELNIYVRVVNAAEWEHSDAKGVCKHRNLHECQPVVEAKNRANQVDLAVTLIHEYAHAAISMSTTNPSARNARAKPKPKPLRTLSGGISTWIRAVQRSILPRGRTTIPMWSRIVSAGSVRPLRK